MKCRIKLKEKHDTPNSLANFTFILKIYKHVNSVLNHNSSENKTRHSGLSIIIFHTKIVENDVISSSRAVRAQNYIMPSDNKHDIKMLNGST